MLRRPRERVGTAAHEQPRFDSDDCIHFTGKDGGGRDRKFTALISVENKEYPTQMYAIDEKGNQEFFIWTRKE